MKSLLLASFPRALLRRQLKLKKFSEVLSRSELNVSFSPHKSPQDGMVHARSIGYRITAFF